MHFYIYFNHNIIIFILKEKICITNYNINLYKKNIYIKNILNILLINRLKNSFFGFFILRIIFKENNNCNYKYKKYKYFINYFYKLILFKLY